MLECERQVYSFIIYQIFIEFGFHIIFLRLLAEGLMKKLKGNLFEVIGSRTRAEILHAISYGPLSVGKISQATRIEQTNISHSLNLLMNSRIVEKKVRGRIHEYSIKEEIRPMIIRIIEDIKKNEELLRKGGILITIGYVIFRIQVTGQIPEVSSYLISNMLGFVKPLG